MSKRLYALFALLIVALLVAACGGAAPAEEPAEEPAAEEPMEEEPMEEEGTSLADLEGEVVVDGSSTVGPLTAAVAEEFAAFAPKVEVPVGISGTGGGFKKFCPGETDISDASRPIKDSEAEICAENGVEYVEFTVALDGLAVMASPENDFVDCLTVEQLGQIFVPDSTVQTWADVNPDWPAEDILLFAPDPDSGTRDYFIEAIIEPYVEDVLGLEGEEAEAMFDIRSDPALTFSTDDNVLLQGIAGEPTGLGFFGYAYYANNQESLKLIEVDGGGGCVAPSDETVQGGTYTPLSRPIFIYVNLESLERPEVYEYVKYYIEEGLQLVMADVGYSVPDDAVLQENLDRFAAATGG